MKYNLLEEVVYFYYDKNKPKSKKQIAVEEKSFSHVFAVNASGVFFVTEYPNTYIKGIVIQRKVVIEKIERVDSEIGIDTFEKETVMYEISPLTDFNDEDIISDDGILEYELKKYVSDEECQRMIDEGFNPYED